MLAAIMDRDRRQAAISVAVVVLLTAAAAAWFGVPADQRAGWTAVVRA